MADLFQLLYVSSAAKSVTQRELDSILKSSRQRNAAVEVSGMLLFIDGNFFQVLEGPESAVKGIFSAIRSDDRHQGILVLLQRPIAVRDFKDWSMGFERMSRAEAETKDIVFQASRESIKAHLNNNVADAVMVFLRNFYAATTREHL